MSWDEITLAVLGGSGVVTVSLIMLREILLKVVEVIQAWRAVRRELRAHDPEGNGHGARQLR